MLPTNKITTQSFFTDNASKNTYLSDIWWKNYNIENFMKYLQYVSPTDLEIYSEQAQHFCKRARTAHLEFLILHTILLEIGGYETCFPTFEEDMRIILERGRFYAGRSKLMLGQPSQCHKNSANLWSVNHTKNDVRICTGYALSEDGLWRQHTWLVHRYQTKTQRRMRIIETTSKRKAYFGCELTDDEAYEFAENNL